MHINFVIKVDTVDRDGGEAKKQIFKECRRSDDGARHRAAKDSWNFTTGYIIAWIGILIYHGSTGNVKSVTNYWKSMPYGIYAPWIQNTMPENAFEHCRRLIHFSGKLNVNHRVMSTYDPLAKIRFVMNKIIASIRSGWTAGKRITIDESMIKYCSGAISFVQYFPK